MKVESHVLLGVAIFFAVVCALYWFTSYEDAGSIMLLLTACLGLLPGGYLLWWSVHMPPRPEDRAESRLNEGAGSIGSFPGSSIWPFVLGMGLALVAVAFVFGSWTAVLGGTLVISAFIGVIVESRRGGLV
ncbi:MAG: aa3-type cytochrome oxidase subunit IV [Acidimicrobiales bacterium]